MERFVMITGFADLGQADYDEPQNYNDHPTTTAWGWLNDNDEECYEFTVLHVAEAENLRLNEVVALFDEEKDFIVEATPENTPDEAWAALAMYRMGVTNDD